MTKSKMAAFRQLLACFGFSREFLQPFGCKYIPCRFYIKEGRLFSLLTLQRLSFVAQTSNHPKSYSICPSFTPRILVKGSINIKTVKNKNTGAMRTYVTDNQEFVSERISISDEYMKDFNDFDIKVKEVKEKAGVLVKMSKNDKESNDNKAKWDILIGGTQREVQNAVSLLKSLLNPEQQKQRLAPMLQATTAKHFGDKEKPIWEYYRRNFKGQKPPMKTRKRCVRGKGEKQTVSGNPCPICRLYLAGGYELDYKDIDLLSQFISPHTGEVFEASKTGLCRVQQEKMVNAIETAKEFGLLPYSIPGPRSLVQPRTAQIPRNVRLK